MVEDLLTVGIKANLGNNVFAEIKVQIIELFIVISQIVIQIVNQGMRGQ